jgi:hypothetical protein
MPTRQGFKRACRVMRFFSVLLSSFLLAIGVIMAVIDATRTIAARDWVFTPLGETWRATWPNLLASLETSLKASGVPFLWDPLMLAILNAPGWAVFFVLAFAFFAAGWRRKRPDYFTHAYH